MGGGCGVCRKTLHRSECSFDSTSTQNQEQGLGCSVSGLGFRVVSPLEV